jgi:hypothetical protein
MAVKAKPPAGDLTNGDTSRGFVTPTGAGAPPGKSVPSARKGRLPAFDQDSGQENVKKFNWRKGDPADVRNSRR